MYVNIYIERGFPGDSEGKACNVGDLGSIPGCERSPGEGNGKFNILILSSDFKLYTSSSSFFFFSSRKSNFQAWGDSFGLFGLERNSFYTYRVNKLFLMKTCLKMYLQLFIFKIPTNENFIFLRILF